MVIKNQKVRMSKWEVIAFLLIYDFLKTTGKRFTRKEFMRAENMQKTFYRFKQLKHEVSSKHAEASLQRVLQILRDKGFILFHGKGSYELTKKGVEECQEVANSITEGGCITNNIRASKWELATFLLIYDFLKTTGKRFTRKEFVKAENMKKIFMWLKQLQHEIYPKHAEASLQRVLQKLRDKGFILFHGKGFYELTKKGVKECQRVARELNS